MPILHFHLTPINALATYIETEHESLTLAAGARLLERVAPLPELLPYRAAMAKCRVVGRNEASR